MAEKRFIPYGRQSISEDDIAAVVEVLRSDWLTQGPMVKRFEQAIADYCGVRYAVAVTNGTAALHLAVLAAGFNSGDEVVTSPITFVASANCILYAGARPVFADIDSESYCIDPIQVAEKITKNTRGIITVHFTGQPCDMKEIPKIAVNHNLTVIEDSAHAIGASYEVDGKEYKIGSCAHSDMTIFSFHPVKHMTTGEGGVITTNDPKYYRKLKLLSTHGITRDPELLRSNPGPWHYEQQELGFNYRITDFQCALGISQLKRLDQFVGRRRKIVARYNKAFAAHSNMTVPAQKIGAHSSWHLYILCVDGLDRKTVFEALRSKGLGVNVHYEPVHLQPYYREHFSFREGDFPVAENYAARCITLPLYPTMTGDDVDSVVAAVLDTLQELTT